MRISALMAMWMCAVFALLCYSVAFGGFLAIDSVADAAEREASRGYIGFWAFLGTVAVVFGVLSWMIKEGRFGNADE
jgi:dipeptide/tripeptide permease